MSGLLVTGYTTMFVGETNPSFFFRIEKSQRKIHSDFSACVNYIFVMRVYKNQQESLLRGEI